MDDIVSVIMADWDAFIALMEDYMARENINRSELARRADISQSQISKILNRQSPPGREAANGIARVLNLPEETVHRAAGLLPVREGDEDDPTLEEANYLLSKLSPEYRDQALALIRFLYERHEKHPQTEDTKPRMAGANGK